MMEDPWISNQDYEGALICMQTKRQIKAVRLIHGGGRMDPETLYWWAEPKEVQALMRAGPIYHLDRERRGFSWSRPRSRHNDNYLISLSKHRRGYKPQYWVFGDTQEMTHHARQLGVEHAYVWEQDNEDPAARGWWSYVRTKPTNTIRIPYDRDTKRVLRDLKTLLETDPPPEDADEYTGYDECETLSYSAGQLIEGAQYTLEFGSHWQCRLTLVILPKGTLYAVMPRVQRPGTDPADYAEIPLTQEERQHLVARVRDTYPP